ncbi:hypothetical protein [Rhodococcus tibetensis]|uniref:Uncharacterized protein n=1 Tax=Rhodococcus tibetensis TaxID=2965064 RepID=A0ABT1QFL9_9NOCA|nr:hypothetical protein [Rhodococcus sp. FXJ9.536]MCQ4121055.1 hypothetical protein [Rhodococcus sp. FXJ9.536]
MRERELEAIGCDPNAADSDADSLEALVELLPGNESGLGACATSSVGTPPDEPNPPGSPEP